MPRVLGLGHVGLYCRDLEKMVAFYRDFLGMTVTKQDWERGMVFLSAEPQSVDHEIALMRGRPDNGDPHLINQISMRVASLDDVRTFYRQIKAAGSRSSGWSRTPAPSAAISTIPRTTLPRSSG